MKHAIFSALVICVSLTACGGRGGDSSSGSPSSPGSTAPVSQSPQSDAGRTLASQPQTIEYYGDSTIRGYESGTGAQVAIPAPMAFAQALPASPSQTVINKGVDNQTACGLLGADWAGKMSASSATVVILNHGINDSRPNIGEDIPTYQSCLVQIARIAKNSGKRVIFETPNPVDTDHIADYVATMKAVATQENVSVIDQYQYLITYLNGASLYTICPDGLHPTQTIYILKGQYAAQVFASLPL